MSPMPIILYGLKASLNMKYEAKKMNKYTSPVTKGIMNPKSNLATR